MTEHLTQELKKKEVGAFHNQLLVHGMDLIKMSRSKISTSYDDWDTQNDVFRGNRYLDSEDVKQARRGKPTKMVVPNTFAQVMTFTSFLFLMFNQNKTFFELVPSGQEDYGEKEQDIERILERDLRKNQWNKLLFQHLLDVGRFGPAILETGWTRKTARLYVPTAPQVINYENVQVDMHGGSEWRDFVKYEGNIVRCVSPYRFFPDMRFPLTDFQKGEFCGAEEEYSMSLLRDLEVAGEVAGVDHIGPLPNDWATKRGGPTRSVMTFDKSASNFLPGPSTSQSEGTVLVTKMQIWLVPNQFEVSPGKKLGPEEFRVLYHLWYANDNRVIRAEPCGWWHNEFGWSISQFTPDMHQTVNLGLADLIYRLQDVISWHINARITDVRRNMRGRLIIDPTGVEDSSIDGDGDIYLRAGAGKSGVDRWVKQLQMSDTTTGHMVDAELLGKIMEVVTGVNGNAMGQYNSGRRSAQEARTVASGAAGRMKLHGHLIWDTGIAPTGRQMMSNSRQALSFESFQKAISKDADQARYEQFKGTPEEVITGDDYFTFDSTLASEKGFIAQSLQELLVAIIANPLAAQQLDLDPRAMMNEIQELRGAGPMTRFSLAKAKDAGAAPLPIESQPKAPLPAEVK
jgi:hypothetical protein